MNPVHITDDNWQDHVEPPDGRKKGLIPRNYATHPVGCLAVAPPFDLPLIPRDQWADLIAKKDAEKSWLSDLRDRGNAGQRIPSLDQDGYGYCWAHSSTSAVTLLRAAMGLPYVPLSAFAVAAIIKGGRDEGGWGLESLEWIAANGIPSQALWPQGKATLSLDTPQMRADAQTRKVTQWMDMEPRNLDQLVTCLLNDIPVVVDFNWWSHSVCACRVVAISPLTIWIWNSWSDSYGQAGIGVLTGSKALPDGQCAPRVTAATAA